MKFIVTLLIIISSFTAYNQTPTSNEINQIATNFLNMDSQRQSVRLKNAQIQEIKKINSVSDDSKILFNVAELEPKGFIIISNDKRLEPIIAYSLNSSFNYSKDSTNILFNLLKKDLTQRLDNRNNNSDKWDNFLVHLKSASNTDFQQWPEPETTNTGGLINNAWQQREPYNKYCPMDYITFATPKRSVVGCVATSLAQIVDYNKSIGTYSLSDVDKYVTRITSTNIDEDSEKFDFPNFSEMNSKLEPIKTKYANGEGLNDDEIAVLNFFCGILLNMNLTACGSFAVVDDISNILKDKLGYESANFAHYRDNVIIKKNIIEGKPVILEVGVSIVGIHTVVADGYNTDDYFHINFGWGETSPDNIVEAWYKIPENMGGVYHFIETTITDIVPSGSAPKLISTKDKLDFGSVSLNSVGIQKEFYLKNTGTTSIAINKINSTNPYTLINGETSQEQFINPGDSILITVQADFKNIEEYTGNILIQYSNDQYLYIPLSGAGIPGNGGTIVNDTILQGVLTKENSPYFFDRRCYIPQNLVIKEGVELIFSNYSDILVEKDAYLTCQGTEDEPIIFKSYSDEIPWQGIKVKEANRVIFKHCHFINSKNCYFGNTRGGAINLNHTSALIDNCFFDSNYSLFGGAVALHYSDLEVFNTVFVNNTAQQNSGAIDIEFSTCKVQNCKFVNNRSFADGGALSTQGENTNLIVENSYFIGNNSDSHGGVISNNSGSCKLENCLIKDNETKMWWEDCAAIYTFLGKVDIINCTIAYNKGEASYAIQTRRDSIYFKGQMPELNIVNSIIWYNEKGPMKHEIYDGGTSWETDTEFEPNVQFSSTEQSIMGEGNIAEIPLFENELCQLLEGSPCIDAGTNNINLSEVDIEGKKRIWNTKVDMGCFEFNSVNTATEEISNNPVDIVVYPNPTNGEFCLRFINWKPGNFPVKIINALGQVQLEKEVCVFNNFYEKTFEISHLSKGTYFIKIFNGIDFKIEKIIMN